MLNLMIVTIIDGVPRVLANPIASLGPLDDWRKEAQTISAENAELAVVWLLDEDGEYPWYRYDEGIETCLLDSVGTPMAQTMEDESA